MITKQQEFLDTLQNPTKGRIKEAVKHFQQSCDDSIREIRITQDIEQSCENEFTVKIIGAEYNQLLKAIRIFPETLEQFMNHPIINRRTWIEEGFDSTFKAIFYVTEA